jgi:colanic acid biosynthesis glycosyl transferase WcaI
LQILYVSQYFPPEACAPAARVDEFTREWAQAGHQVRVLTGFPNHPEGALHPEYRHAWRQGFLREERQGVRIYRTWLYPAANAGLWGRLANYGTFALSAAITGPWVAQRHSVVIATSPQLLVGAAGYGIARSRGLAFVFEVRDLWPQSIDAVGAAGKESFLYRALERLASFLYRRADCIVVDGERKRQQLMSIGVEKRIEVVRNGVPEDFCPDPESEEARKNRERIRGQLGLRDEFVLLYAGTIGMAHGLDTVLDAATTLREERDIVFVVVGEGAEREKLSQQIAELRLANVRYLGKRPRAEIPAFLAAADACLAPLRRREVFKTAIPSKMFEAMAAARPVILGVEGEAKNILLEARAGVAVAPEDSQALCRAIRALRANAPWCRELGTNGRQAVLQKYSRRNQAAAYLDLLSEIVSDRVPEPVPPCATSSELISTDTREIAITKHQ